MVSVRFSMLLIPLVVTGACVLQGSPNVDDSNRFVPLKGGLVKTNIAYWEVRDFAYAGIRAELPMDVFYAADLPMRATIMLNPVYPPRFALAEPTCLITIGLERWDAEKRSVMRDVNLGAGTGDGQPTEIQTWEFSWHEQLSRFDQGVYSYFRLDVSCPDDTTVFASAELVRQGENGDGTHGEDVEVIKRVLTSLTCIDPKPVPQPVVPCPTQ